MRRELKEEINILFLKDTGKLLINENLKYLIIPEENGLKVGELPIVFNGYLHLLYDYLAYDFDELDPTYQEKYHLHSKKIKKQNDDYYKIETKTYKKNNQH